MKKLDTFKKLKQYALVSGATLVTSSANAEIIYTDLDPDKTFSKALDIFNIDFDGDGKIDVNIQNLNSQNGPTTGTYFGFSYVFSSANNRVAVSAGGGGNKLLHRITTSSNAYGTFTNYSIKALKVGDSISSTPYFLSQTGALMMQNEGYLNWPFFPGYNTSWDEEVGEFKESGINKYLGVSFSIGANTHYGWVRLSATVSKTSQSFTVMDFAYNNVADEKILAGEGSLTFGINDLERIDANLYINNNMLFIDFNERISGDLTIINLSGATVYSDKIIASKYNSQLNLNSGIYIVNVKTEKGIFSEKISI